MSPWVFPQRGFQVRQLRDFGRPRRSAMMRARQPHGSVAMDSRFALIEVTDDDGARGRARRGWRAPRACTASCAPRCRRTTPRKMRRVFAGGGRMMVAAEGEAVRGVAVWRVHENTFAGVQLYVDDLVTDEAQRSRGVGHALHAVARSSARARAVCTALMPGLGHAAQQAHKLLLPRGDGRHRVPLQQGARVVRTVPQGRTSRASCAPGPGRLHCCAAQPPSVAGRELRGAPARLARRRRTDRRQVGQGVRRGDPGGAAPPRAPAVRCPIPHACASRRAPTTS